MIFKLAFCLLLTFLLGLFSLSLLWPRLSKTRPIVLVKICLAFGFGSGISSLLFFLWLCAFASRGEHFSHLVLSEIVLVIILGFACAFRRRSAVDSQIPRSKPRKESFARLCSVTFYILVLFGVVSFVLLSIKNPHGHYDAVGLWNLRARFLARGTEQWRSAFVDSAGIPHPDYPLLLPATVARFWKYLGEQTVVVPMTVAFLFTFSTVGLTWASLNLLRSRQDGYLAGSVLLGINSFISLGTAQYADTVISFFMLAAIVLSVMYDVAPEKGNLGFLILSGACAAFCAWVKNEGVLFFLLFLLVRLLFSMLRNGWTYFRLEATRILTGALPILIAVGYFKLRVTSGNFYLTTGQSTESMRLFIEPASFREKLLSFPRYLLIAKSMAREVLHLGGRPIGIVPILGLYLVASRVKRSKLVIAGPGTVVLLMLLVGYFFVYVTTSLNLELHLQTSLLRLLLQVWPSSVFLYFLVVSTNSSEKNVIDLNSIMANEPDGL